MPIPVSCSCGKTFRVKDDLAGRTVTCQVCGNELRVEPPLAAADGPALVSKQPGPPPAAADTIACPTCAETIPRASRRCPMCNELVRGTLTAAERDALLQGVIDALATDRPGSDPAGRLPLITVKTWVVGSLTLACVGAFVYGRSLPAGGGDAIAVVAVILGVCFGIGLLVSFVNDYRAQHIQDVDGPQIAVYRFFSSLRTGRGQSAFAAVAPSARVAARAEPIRLNNPKIAHHASPLSFNDRRSFSKYWKQLFQGPDGHTRNVKLVETRVVSRRHDVVAVVEARFRITSYSKWLLLLIFLNIILCAIVIAIVQQKDEIRLTKVLVRHRGRWYLGDGTCEGELDRALR